MSYLARFWAIVAYLTTIVAANWLASRYGLVPIGFGLLATAGTYAAGAAFVARDLVQDLAGRAATIAVLLLGALLSLWLSSPALAIASAVAFGVSELADMAIYTPLRRRGYVRAAVASNLVGSIIDTYLFLSISGFGIAPSLVLGQIVGKTWVTLAVVCLVVAGRAALRRKAAA